MYPYIDGTLSPSGTTTSYGYGNSTWKDLMTSYSGQTITYDTIGNPLQYRDGMTMTWQNGRQLAGISKSGLNVAYTYNGDGIRTGKTVNGVKTSFIVDGSTIVSQQGTAESGAYAINYLYDENGKAYGFYYNDDIYYYEFDGQGDVVSLLDHHGDLAASYTYDTWGKLLSVKDCDGRPIMDPSDVANLNIFLYRGYCYDTETGLYYLQSRYYDPNTGRFVNADGTVNANQDLKTNDLFVYCGNNPVNNSDYNGQWYMGHTDAEIVALMTEDGTMNSGYDVVADLGDRPGYMSDDDFANLQEILRKNNIAGAAINGTCGAFTLASCAYTGADAVFAASEAGCFAAFSLLLSPITQWTDPRLTSNQKCILTLFDAGSAALGTFLSVEAACAIGGPIGWAVGSVIAIAFTIGGIYGGGAIEDWMAEDNGWGYYS